MDSKNNPQQNHSIGTYKEKSLHSFLKLYYEPNEQNHEIKLGGFIADILCEDGVYEIQTAGFDKLRKKLAAFLEATTVTVVHPIPHRKWISWIDTQTGEVQSKRKSPKVGTAFDISNELYKIRSFLNHPNLRFIIVLIDIDEYRYLNGWSHDKKRGSTRHDRIPLNIVEEIQLNSPFDYYKLLPPNTPPTFISKQLSKLAKASPKKTQSAISVLREVGIIKQIGKQERFNLYEVIDINT